MFVNPVLPLGSACLALAFLDEDAEPESSLFMGVEPGILPLSGLSALGTGNNIPLDFLFFLNVSAGVCFGQDRENL